MIHVLLVSALLSQSYSRSRQDDTGTSQCLWWKENTSIVWRANAQGNDETPGDTEFTALERSFDTWQTELAACSSLSLVKGARIASRETTYNSDGTNDNVIVFRQRKCSTVVAGGDPCWSDGSCGTKHDCWQYTDGAIAITTTSFSPRTGQILDSDIELNTPSYIFTTVDSPACVRGSEAVTCIATDVQNTMTHEIGHLLGLAHISDPASTMNPRAVTGELIKRTLDSGSKKFVCDVYPKGGYSKTCFTPRLTTESLTAAKTGCSATPGLALVGAALLFARRRR